MNRRRFGYICVVMSAPSIAALGYYYFNTGVYHLPIAVASVMFPIIGFVLILSDPPPMTDEAKKWEESQS